MAQHILRRPRNLPATPAREEAERMFRPQAPIEAPQAPPVPQRQKPGRKPPPPGESRRATFVRLANKRVSDAIDQITLIGNLANRKNYSFNSSDVDQIEAALVEAVRLTMAAFRSPKATVPTFRLSMPGEPEEC